MKRILLISQYFYPEMISTGHILTELLCELSANGIRSSVICAQPTYYSRNKVKQQIIYRGINIIRTANTQYDKNTIKGKLFNSGSFFILALIRTLRDSDRCPVFLVTNPPFLGLIGLILKKLKNRPFLLIIHDLYPDVAVNAGYLKKQSLIVKLWRWLNKWIFKKAFFVVTLGRDVKDRIMNQMPNIQRDKIVYIPNWADPTVIQPIEFSKNTFIKDLALTGKFIVQYSGNMGLLHDMETIIEAANVLRHQQNIQFLLIGDGGKRKKMEEMISKYKLQNIILLPYQPRENLKNSLGAAHVSIISQEIGSKGLSVPSKMYGIMASGRPAIGIVPDHTEVALTLREFEFGIVTPPKDVDNLVCSINWMVNHDDERILMGIKAYKAFMDHFTVGNCAQKYIELLRKM